MKKKQFALGMNLLNGYRKIHSIEELLDLKNTTYPNWHKVHRVDLSSLDLREYGHLFVGELNNSTPETILAWTDDVIWPSADKMPKGFKPKQILEDAKRPHGLGKLHAHGITGKNIGIAILDQRLNRKHPEYADQIKHYEVMDNIADKDGIDYHGSLVTGCVAGKTTGTAPDIDVYYFAGRTIGADGKHTRESWVQALKKLLELNKTLPEHKKIRFVSCSWGGKDDLMREECEKLFAECERNGMFVLGGFYHLPDFIDYGAYDYRYANKNNTVGIPTNGKTTPFWRGGYYYTRDGGASSTFPYLAGVFACALQNNQIFCTQKDWQKKLSDIMRETAIESPRGGSMINPTGIVERVAQISRSLEQQMIKNKEYE